MSAVEDARAPLDPEVTMSVTKLYTAEDLLAMGSDVPYELIEGELIEVSPSEWFSSELGSHLLSSLHAFVYGRRLGRLSGEAGGYLLSRDPDSVVAPDIGFLRLERAPKPIARGLVSSYPPDLAVEVMSASDRYADLVRKAKRYLDAGTRLVWIVRPDRQTVVVFAPGRDPVELGLGDELDGEDVLPGFRLSVAAVFADPLASKRAVDAATDSAKYRRVALASEATMSVTKRVTAADLLAMGSDASYELIEGELVYVPFSDGFASEIALGIAVALRAFVRPTRLGYITGADGGYVLARDPDTVMAPDVGFISVELVPVGLPTDDYVPYAPTLAVEVLSGWDSIAAVVARVNRYLSAGARLVWVARPDRRTVVVFAPGRDPVEVGEDAELDGEKVLPGFRLPVRDVFADPLAS